MAFIAQLLSSWSRIDCSEWTKTPILFLMVTMASKWAWAHCFCSYRVGAHHFTLKDWEQDMGVIMPMAAFIHHPAPPWLTMDKHPHYYSYSFFCESQKVASKKCFCLLGNVVIFPRKQLFGGGVAGGVNKKSLFLSTLLLSVLETKPGLHRSKLLSPVNHNSCSHKPLCLKVLCCFINSSS